MPRPHRKAKTPLQEPAPAEQAVTPPTSPAPAAPEPDVFDEAIAARQEAQAQQAQAEASRPPEPPPAPDSQPQHREWQSKLPDPFPRHSIDLGEGKRMRLFRNTKFQQSAIVFYAPEGVDPKPDKDDREFLKAHSWRWRPEVEGKPWTKQFLSPDDKAAIEQIATEQGEQAGRAERSRRRADGDRQTHDEFVVLANAIRQRHGLEPIDYSFGQDASRGY